MTTISDERLAAINAVIDANPYPDYTYVAQTPDVERGRARRYARMIALQVADIPIVRDELRPDLVERSAAQAALLRDAADDCEDCANDLLNQAPIMGPTKEAKYRKEAQASIVRAFALRAWADSLSPKPSREEHEHGDCAPGAG
jgi:hypothetical protein